MTAFLKGVSALAVVLMVGCHGGKPMLAEPGHEHVATVYGVRAKLINQSDKQELTVRIGPFNLPPHAGHTISKDLFLIIPIQGWIKTYDPRLTDEKGYRLPNQLLHHVALINTARPDLICEKGEELVFSTGGEMTAWATPSGMGYPVKMGDKIRIWPMLHNPTETPFPKTYIEIQMTYSLLNEKPGLQNIYPFWIYIGNCPFQSNTQSLLFNLRPNKSVKTHQVNITYPGKLIWFIGHLHDFGQELRLDNLTRQEEIVTINPILDSAGRIVGIPTVSLVEKGGYHLNRDEVLQLTAIYENPTRKMLSHAGMAVIGGYFLPDKDEELAVLQLRRR